MAPCGADGAQTHRGLVILLSMVPPRVLLLNEPYGLGHTETDVLSEAPPYSLQVLTGALEAAGVETRMLDLTRSFTPRAEIDRAISSFQPDIVGFSAARMVNASAMRELVDHVRRTNRDIALIAGGQMATFAPEYFLDDDGVDVVVRGEGEQALIELIEPLLAREDLEGRPATVVAGPRGLRFGPPRPPLEDLDQLPRPSRKGRLRSFFRDGETAAIETVRGCPMRCLHCPIPTFQRDSFRRRSVDSLLDELEELRDTGVTELMIYDQCFGVSPASALALAEGILRRGLRFHIFAQTRAGLAVTDRRLWDRLVEAGLYSLLLYFDSNASELVGAGRAATPGDERSLCLALRERGVLIIGMGLVAAPGQSAADDLRTAARHYELSDVYSPTVYTPFIGSPAHEALAARDGLRFDSYRDFNYVKYVIAGQRDPRLVGATALAVRAANHLLPLKQVMTLLPGQGRQREMKRREYRAFARTFSFVANRFLRRARRD